MLAEHRSHAGLMQPKRLLLAQRALVLAQLKGLLRCQAGLVPHAPMCGTERAHLHGVELVSWPYDLWH